MSQQYDALFAMLRKASQHLRYPKIRFHVEEQGQGYRIQVSLATKGYIAIKIDGEYVGKIMPDGAIYLYGLKDWMRAAIMEYCQHPLENAKIIGQRFNYCCFCASELTNKISVQVGYGPICASNFGLPWESIEPEQCPDEEM